MRGREDTEVTAWLRRASDDRQTARLVAPHSLHAVVGFHCQQEAEKLLKALLVALDVAPPRLHHLPSLVERCRACGLPLQGVDEACRRLAPLATVSRYPGQGDLSQADAAAALEAAAVVRDTVAAAFADHA
jgi:HEPN domain-containing protein